ncbi:MAG: hypothetical protein IJ428_00740 [Clostridia bacterium]|nr:hypothetical protein [Clostridia bacterium]
MKWIENFRVNSHDCDESGKMRPSLILRYMQETANLQLRALGPTAEQLVSEDRAFILSRINMSIYGDLHAYEDISVSSWACDSRGVSFNRCYQIRRQDELIAEAASVWGLIGISDRKIYRVEDVTLGFETDEPLELDSPRRVHIPRELSLSLVGERTIVYSDIDANRHMNNTNYPDMLCCFIPHIAKKRVLSVGISFAAEAKQGETLKVYMSEVDGTYYFRTIRTDGSTNVEAMIMVED